MQRKNRRLRTDRQAYLKVEQFKQRSIAFQIKDVGGACCDTCVWNTACARTAIHQDQCDFYSPIKSNQADDILPA